MVAALNPVWNEPATDAEVDARFEQASTLMGQQFLKKVDYYGKSWLPARDIVIKGLEESRSLDSQGRILHLPQFCPWKVIPPLFLVDPRLTLCRSIFLIWRKNVGLWGKRSTFCFRIIHPPLTASKPCLYPSIVFRTVDLYLNSGGVFGITNYPLFRRFQDVSSFMLRDSSGATSLLTVLYKWRRRHWKCSFFPNDILPNFRLEISRSWPHLRNTLYQIPRV